MSVIVVGVNYRTTPVELRERFAISEEAIPGMMQELTGDGLIRECLILSTCNRVEIYALTPDAGKAVPFIQKSFSNVAGNPPLKGDEFYKLEHPESIRHLFEVGAGLDSMVVGETEILGQVKEAYRIAHGLHRTGLALNRLFQTSFAVAKEIRSKTRIGMGSVSVGSVAADLASQIFGDLNKKSILLLGAGETGQTTARALQARGAKDIQISNRSHDKAVELAAQLRGQSIPWDQWPTSCCNADIIITATGAGHLIVTRELLNDAMESRGGKPLFLIDIAVPRNVERAVSDLDSVYLYDVDDLQIIADRNHAMRQQESALCKQIVREHVDTYQSWFLGRMDQLVKCPTARIFDRTHLHKNRPSEASS